MTGRRTWAQHYALAFGTVLVVFMSVVALLAAVSLVARVFGAHKPLADLDDTAFAISHWHHALLYAIAGVLGLATWRRADSARVFALAAGIAFVAVAVLGLILHGAVWVTSASLVYDIVNATIGVAGIVAGTISPRHRVRIARAPAAV